MVIQKFNRGIFMRSYSSLVVSTSVPIVKTPAYVKAHLEKVKLKEKRKQLQKVVLTGFKGNTRFPIISSNNKQLNFYLGQKFDQRLPIPLISKHWKKKSTSGQSFLVHKTSSDYLWKIKTKDIQNVPSEFSAFNLHEKLLNVLKDSNLHVPSPVQGFCIPKILEHRNVMFVAETGSGKTMSYVIPVLQHIIRLKERVSTSTAESPLAIIVVPGKELAEQIGHEAFKICEPCGVSVRVLIHKGTKLKHLVPKRDENIDFLVASFGVLDKLIRKGVFSVSRLRHLVLDEADTLLDDSFIKEIVPFLQFIMTANCPGLDTGVQIVLSSAIYPSNLNELHALLPSHDIENIVLPHAHHLLTNISHKFMRVRNSHKSGVLLELVKNDLKKHAPVMIFSNQSPGCDWTAEFLADNKIHCKTLHAGMNPNERSAAFFGFQEGEVDVLCCTDVASRGLDTQRVKHVINFDFPNNMSDYIQRCGRVGRLGSNHGHVTNLITKVPEAAVVQDIEMAVRNSTKLPAVDSNIKGKLRSLYPRYDK